MRSASSRVLHGMGCEFALDNFGSGLSSFSTLKTLPMDYLKIDGSFIKNLAGDTVNQAMVAAMIELSRSLNFRVVAEHVEDQLGARHRDGHGHRFRAGLRGGTAATVVHGSEPGRRPVRALITRGGSRLITNFYGISCCA